MSDTVKKTTEQLHSLIIDALGRAVAEGELPEEAIPAFNIEIPANRDNGDYSTNLAFVCAKAFRCAPRKIADALAKHIDLNGTYFSDCSVAGAGFINFTLAGEFYADVLLDIKNSGEKYGRSDYGKGKRVNVEFVSANPTGPMHIGNARGGALGDCLAAVLSAAGYEVEREFYINDAGNQIEKFGMSLDIRYQQLHLGENAPELPEDSYHGADITERAKEFSEIYGDEYINKSEAERRNALVEFALPKNIEGLKTALGAYRISYDTWFHESELHKGAIQAVVDTLTANGMTYEKACIFSSAVSALKCTHIGARDGVPQLDEVIEFLKERGYDEFEKNME